jgi:hypothetical protein
MVGVAGANVSTVQLYVAVLALPTRSVPLTWNAWLPSASPEYVFGLEQLEKAAPSRLHWKLADSFAEKEKAAVVPFVGLGGEEVIVTTGGVVSTVSVLAELVPRLPAESCCSACPVHVPSGRVVDTEYELSA